MKEKLKFIAAFVIFYLGGIAIGCGLTMYAEHRDAVERGGREDCEVAQEHPVKITVCGHTSHWRYGQ